MDNYIMHFVTGLITRSGIYIMNKKQQRSQLKSRTARVKGLARAFIGFVRSSQVFRDKKKYTRKIKHKKNLI